MKTLFLTMAMGALILASGCAKESADIAPQYVSPLQYQPYSCRQIAAEAQSVSARASSLMGVQDKKASSDKVAMGVGLILFWPSLFFLHGNSETTAQVAGLKGQMDALEEASIQKNCGIVFQHAPVKPPGPQPAAAAPASK
ncbi:hypothetical protein GC209_17210 [bacterium]|nr:hypothetical protein [bacterium]